MSTSGTSASGARIQGDDYQHVYAWSEALRLLRPEDEVVCVEVEAANSGNVDDVVVRRGAGAHRYSQVKYSVDASRPISHEWLTACETERSTSPLQKFWSSWRQLRTQGVQPQMLLVTNRSLDTSDPALKLRSGRRGLLVPGLGGVSPGSEAGRRRKSWAQHLGVSENRLLEMFEHLELKTDYGSWSTLVDVTAERMAALGLRADEEAVYCGASSIRSRVTQGIRGIDRDALERELDRWRLRGGRKSATLLVQAIDWDPWPDSAVARLDWVDCYVGSEPRGRRQLRDPADWNGRLRPEMVAAAKSIKGKGFDRVFVKGAMRLTTWFLAGAELPDVRGHDVACSQKGVLWTSEGEPEASPLTICSTDLSQGDDLAVGLSVSANIGPEVVAFLKEGMPVASYLDIAPAAGAGPSAIIGPAHAKGWALAVRDAIRTTVSRVGARRIHLFMAAPAGCALLLGHYWNRLPETQLYEDLNPGYCPSYAIPG